MSTLFVTQAEIVSGWRKLNICRIVVIVGLFSAGTANGQSLFDERYSGEWGFSVEDQMDNKHLGTLSIHDCVNHHCQYSLMTGTERSMCSSEGELQIHSENFASEVVPSDRDSEEGDSCEIDLTLINKNYISVSSKGSCTRLCGLNASFDAELERLSAEQFYPTSFNCYEFTSRIELSVCTNKNLAELDTRLYKLYDQARDAASQENRQALKKDQLKWLRERDSTCAKSKVIKDCLKAVYLSRIEQLN